MGVSWQTGWSGWPMIGPKRVGVGEGEGHLYDPGRRPGDQGTDAGEGVVGMGCQQMAERQAEGGRGQQGEAWEAGDGVDGARARGKKGRYWEGKEEGICGVGGR